MSTSAAQPSEKSEAPVFAAIAVISAVALALIGWVLFGGKASRDPSALSFLPTVNACMNALSAACQVAAIVAIRQRRRELHRNLMLGALAASALFFVGYLVYHRLHGDTPYPQGASLRGVYLAVLASHVLGSIAVVPMVLVSFARALRAQKDGTAFDKHKRIAKLTFPLWLYVSVTGIVVFLMLRAAT